MNGVNYYLLFKGNSDKEGLEVSVRGFIKLEAAQTAMDESHRKLAVALGIPVGPDASSDPHTTRTKSSIRLERHGDWFQWEIIRAVPEDGGADKAQEIASISPAMRSDCMDFQKISGERIAQRRKEFNLTQQQLGEKTGLSKQAINNIECGRRSTLAIKTVAIAKALETTVEYLVGTTDNPMRPM